VFSFNILPFPAVTYPVCSSRSAERFGGFFATTGSFTRALVISCLARCDIKLVDAHAGQEFATAILGTTPTFTFISAGRNRRDPA